MLFIKTFRFWADSTMYWMVGGVYCGGVKGLVGYMVEVLEGWWGIWWKC